MRKYNVFLIILFILFCFLFSYIYLKPEAPIYPCDFVDYNLSYYDFGTYLKNSDFNSFLSELTNEIYNSNRNPFLVIFLLPFFFIFKVSRLGFVFAIETIFMMPVMMLLYNLIRKNLSNYCNYVLLKIAIISAIFLCPALWLCPLRGIPDICGMIPIILAWMIYLKNDINSKFNWKIILSISLLLYLSFLFRRWYSVVIFAFLAAYFIDFLINTIIQKENFKFFIKRLGITILNSISILLIIISSGLLIQNGYIKNILNAEASERKLFSFGVDLFHQLQYVFLEEQGWIYLIISIIGALFCIKNRFLRFIIINLTAYLFAFFVLMNSQFLWINHYIFPATCILILFIAGCLKIISKCKNNFLKDFFTVIIIFINILNFLFYFIVPCPNCIQPIFHIRTGVSMQNKNAYIAEEIYNYLEKEYNKSPNIKVAIYGLSQNIGYYQFRSLSSNSKFSKENILCEPVLDSDYYFNELLADYAIVIDSEIYIKDSTLTRMLDRTKYLFKNNIGIAKNYTLIQEYKTDNDERIYLYKKIKPLTVKQMQDYASYFYEFYPEWEEKFNKILSENNF